MIVQHFNRSPQQGTAFEDAALDLTSDDATFALDAGFDLMGVPDTAFVLVPGVVCCVAEDSVDLSRQHLLADD